MTNCNGSHCRCMDIGGQCPNMHWYHCKDHNPKAYEKGGIRPPDPAMDKLAPPMNLASSIKSGPPKPSEARTMDKPADWEESFEKRFSTTQVFPFELRDYKDDTKQFIREIIAQERAAISKEIGEIIVSTDWANDSSRGIDRFSKLMEELTNQQ